MKTNSEYMVEYNRKRTATDPEYAKRRRETINKSRRKQGHKGRRNASDLREAVIAFLIERDGYYCSFCGGSLEGSAIHVNHKIAHAEGGPNLLSNLDLAHPSCNIRDGVKVRERMKRVTKE